MQDRYKMVAKKAKASKVSLDARILTIGLILIVIICIIPIIFSIQVIVFSNIITTIIGFIAGALIISNR